MKKVTNFFSQLISDNDAKSSSRFASLVALAVSSWVLIYVTINHEQYISDLFLYYIVTFAAQYSIGKTLSVIKTKGTSSDDVPPSINKG